MREVKFKNQGKVFREMTRETTPRKFDQISGWGKMELLPLVRYKCRLKEKSTNQWKNGSLTLQAF